MSREFVDTNVLVYLHDDGEPDKQRIAQDIFDDESARDLVFSTQVLGEFFVTATRKLGMSPDDVSTALSVVLTFPIEAVDRKLVVKATDTVRRHQLSYWDALIVEAAVAGGCDRILTEDLTDGQTIRGVEIVNPFASQSSP